MKTFQKYFAVALIVALTLSLNGPSVARAATTLSLGTAGSFAILAGSTITNTGSSVISGDLGLSPGTSVTGFPPGTVNGTQQVANAAAIQAQADLTTAYNNAAGQTPASTVPAQLGGTTKTAGVYNSADGSFGITGTLTLDAQGDTNAVFIFNSTSTLITAAGSNIVLANGTQACNVFWQVGSSVTLGTSSSFKGNLLVFSSATLTTGASVEGRVLARNGAVTLDSNPITKCTLLATSAPVVPLSSTAAPLISITKVPTPLSLPNGPGSVTYDYTVLNIGTVAMSSVTVADDKCSILNFISGDTNVDAKLDTNETWKYNCTTTLQQTTTNIVTATGQANNLTASSTATATVVVTPQVILAPVIAVPSSTTPLITTPAVTVPVTTPPVVKPPVTTTVITPPVTPPTPPTPPKLPNAGIDPSEESIS